MSYTFSDLPINDSGGKAYTYTVQEDPVAYYTADYDYSAPGIVKITNTYTKPYTLPETGGIGTYIFYGVGGGIILLAAVLMIVYQQHVKHGKKRKRRHDGRNE